MTHIMRGFRSRGRVVSAPIAAAVARAAAVVDVLDCACVCSQGVRSFPWDGRTVCGWGHMVGQQHYVLMRMGEVRSLQSCASV